MRKVAGSNPAYDDILFTSFPGLRQYILGCAGFPVAKMLAESFELSQGHKYELVIK